jgi:hypothetical protein
MVSHPRRQQYSWLFILYSTEHAVVFFFLILDCEAIGTAATPWPIVQASGDSEDDCGEADGM